MSFTISIIATFLITIIATILMVLGIIKLTKC